MTEGRLSATRPGDTAPAPAAVADMLAVASRRDQLDDAPGKSGATLERLHIDGRDYVLKHLDLSADWTMRASGSLRGVPLDLWERGILRRLPACINQPIVGVVREPPSGARPSGGCAVLMHDVSRWLVPATDAPIPPAQHARFLAHMAAMHAAFWACGDEFDVVPAMHRYLELSPWMAEAEAAIGSDHLVPQLVAKGWPLLADVAPAAAAVALDTNAVVRAVDGEVIHQYVIDAAAGSAADGHAMAGVKVVVQDGDV